MAASKLLQNKGRCDHNENTAILNTPHEMHDGKLSDDEQMRMMLAEERISTMMALQQMGYGRHPLQTFGQIWPGLPNPFNTFCPFPPHLLATNYGQTSNEPLDLTIPKKEDENGAGKEGPEELNKKRQTSDNCFDCAPSKRRKSRDDSCSKPGDDVTRDVTARRIKRRSSSTRRSRESPAVPISVVPLISAFKLHNNNQTLQEPDDHCANCEEIQKLTVSQNGRDVSSRDKTMTPEGTMADEGVAARLFQPIPGLECSPTNDKQSATSGTPSEQFIGTPDPRSPDCDSLASDMPDSDAQTSELPASCSPISDISKPLVIDEIEEKDEGLDELRSENLAFKQMLASLSSEVEKLRKMMNDKKGGQ